MSRLPLSANPLGEMSVISSISPISYPASKKLKAGVSANTVVDTTDRVATSRSLLSNLVYYRAIQRKR